MADYQVILEIVMSPGGAHVIKQPTLDNSRTILSKN